MGQALAWRKCSEGGGAAAPGRQEREQLDQTWKAWPVAAACCHTCRPGS